MRPFAVLVLVVTAFALLTFQGFQCASSEFTGAKLQLQQKNFKEAKRLLELEVKKNPGNEEAWYLLGAVDGDEQDYKAMNEAFNEALKISDKHKSEIHSIRYNKWGQHLNAGVNYLERATPESSMYFDKSIAEFNMAIDAWPDTALTYKYLGYTYNNRGDYDSASIAFRTAWEQGGDVEALKRLARIYIFQGDKYKSKFDAENAEPIKILKNLAKIRKNSRKNDVMTALGAPENIKRGSRSSRKEEWYYGKYNLTLTIEKDRVTAKEFSKPYVPNIDSTNYFAAMKEYNEAITLLQSAKAATEEDAEVLNIMLNAFVQANRIKEAITEYERVTRQHPDNKMNHYILGVLYRSAADFSDAVKEFQKASELDPSFTDAIFDLGATYYNWGVEIMKSSDEKGETSTEHKEKFKKALPYLQQVAEEKSDDSQVWETLGTINAQLGNQDEAIKDFDRSDFLKKNPIKLEMSYNDITSYLGEPDSKTDNATYQNAPATMWKYNKQRVSLYFVDGKLKGWMIETKK